MKVLFLTSRLPWPLEKGDKLRAFHQLKALGTQHEVHLFCLVESTPSAEACAALEEITVGFHWYQMRSWRRILRMAFSLFSSRPFQVHWFYQRGAANALSSIIKDVKPERIHCQLIRMTEYVKNEHEIPKNLDYMDALSAGMLRRSYLKSPPMSWIFAEEATRLKRYESSVFDYFDSHSIISRADGNLIAHPEKGRIKVVPNGVDTVYFTPLRSDETHLRSIQPLIVFTGNMNYPPNVDAVVQLVHHVLPLVLTPNVKVLIAGANPARAVRVLASERVEVSGWIDDIRLAYAQAHVLVAPLRIGTGQQNKILEGMACGLPCVTTSHVMEGFAGQDGAQNTPPLEIADSPSDMAKRIDILLETPQMADEIGKESRNWVLKNAHWKADIATITTKLEAFTKPEIASKHE